MEIIKHLEYVAQLEAQLHGSPYCDVGTAALAKRALETELVRLEAATAESTAGTATDTWTSHIKTLEWLVKLPTMSLTFDTFKSVLTDEHVELVQLFLTLTDIDPSADTNYAIYWASKNGHANVVKVLLADSRVNQSVGNNYTIRRASAEGFIDVVKVLLGDHRVDPSAEHNFAIRYASELGHTDVVKLLLEDTRLDPTSMYTITQFAGQVQTVIQKWSRCYSQIQTRQQKTIQRLALHVSVVIQTLLSCYSQIIVWTRLQTTIMQ